MKELRSVLAALTEVVPVEDSPLDEIRARRERKLREVRR